KIIDNHSSLKKTFNYYEQLFIAYFLTSNSGKPVYSDATLVTLDDSLTLRYRLWRLPFSQRERLTPREKTRYRSAIADSLAAGAIHQLHRIQF
ncbi:MAG: hypothetical protein V7L27_14615, partial [Nostoc sp.]|uniref:hypothetical protein n=1 Tax=Nostoc sp. TaxID=1180 RepID=UPI002FF4A989